jgi:hypothetical protein
MKTQVLTDTGLTQYDELIKNYIKEKIDELDNAPNEVFSTTEPETQNEGDIWTKLL